MASKIWDYPKGDSKMCWSKPVSLPSVHSLHLLGLPALRNHHKSPLVLPQISGISQPRLSIFFLGSQIAFHFQFPKQKKKGTATENRHSFLSCTCRQAYRVTHPTTSHIWRNVPFYPQLSENFQHFFQQFQVSLASLLWWKTRSFLA